MYNIFLKALRGQEWSRIRAGEARALAVHSLKLASRAASSRIGATALARLSLAIDHAGSRRSWP